MNTKAVAAVAVVAVLLGAGAAVAFFALSNSKDDSYPDKFDQRDKGIVTSVKYQNPWGTCWSFGSTGAAETSVLTSLGMTASQYKEKNGYELDFSEKHLAWFALNPITDNETDSQAGEGFMLVRDSDKHDYHYIYDNGGKASMAASLYSTGVGPVSEKGNPEAVNPLFKYAGKNGLTAKDFFANETTGVANTKAYLDYFAYNNLNDKDGYKDYLQIIEETKLNILIGEYKSWGVVLPDDFDAAKVKADVDDAYDILVSALRTFYINKYTANNEYSEMDDWVIPLDGSYRNLTAGYTMVNGNMLIPPCNVKDETWDGLNDARMNLIKKELYAGHGMGMSYNYSAANLNTETWAQFDSDNGHLGISNHAIQVVGWDDNYSKDNFNTKPEQNGAWLCKNSWGSQTDYKEGDVGYQPWGIKNSDGKHTGYFWLSYCDRSINRIMSYEFGKSPAETFNTYVYDFLPSQYEETLSSADVIKTANVFTIGETKEKLSSVSIRTGYLDSDVKVSVYKLDDNYDKDATKGTLLWETSKNFELEGFHRITVDKDIELSPGQKISVVVEEKNTHFKDGAKYIADYNYGYTKDKVIEKEGDNLSNTSIYCVTKVNEGESYLLMDGKWRDWHATWADPDNVNNGIQVDNFRIKMFTVDAAA